MRSRLGLVGISLLFAASACGDPTSPRQSLPTTPTVNVSPFPSLTPSPSPSSTAWKTYSNSEFGFAVEYPADFKVTAKPGDQSVVAGLLLRAYFVDQKYPPGTESPGAVNLGVHVKDAASVEDWVAKHSTEGYAAEDPKLYYHDVSNKRSLSVNGHPAIAFDWQSADAGPVHVVAFFIGERVFELVWFAPDPSYAPTLEPIFQRMLDSYRD